MSTPVLRLSAQRLLRTASLLPAILLGAGAVPFGVGDLAPRAPFPSAQAQARLPAARMTGQELAGYGRLRLSFPRQVPTTARVSNSVMIIGFGEPVSLDIGKLLTEVPSYVSQVRVDPDGRGVRLALLRNVRPNLMPAGDTVFVDLIPEGWRGVLPGPPTEFVAELGRRAQEAEALARELSRRTDETPVSTVEVRSARLPTATRLIFPVPARTPVSFEAKDGTATLAVRGRLRFEPSKLRALLPEGVTLADTRARPDGFGLTLALGDAVEAQGFQEDDGYIVDLRQRPSPAPEAAQQAAAVPSPQPPPPSARQAEAPAAAAQPPAAPPQPAPPPVAAAPAPAAPSVPQSPQAVAVSVDAAEAQVAFRFPRRTAAAAFAEDEQVTLVFDTIDTLGDVAAVPGLDGLAGDVAVSRQGRVSVVRMMLRKPGLVRFGAETAGEETTWTLSLGEKGVAAALPVAPKRALDNSGRNVLNVPLPGVSGVHWVQTEAGQLAVATAHAPGRALPKPQRFVDLMLLRTAQGLAVRPFADDVVVRAGIDSVTLSRSDGLVITETEEMAAEIAAAVPQQQPVANREAWAELQLGDVLERGRELAMRTAEAGRSQRTAARLDQVAYLMANGLFAEALGPLAMIRADDPQTRRDRRIDILRGISQIAMGRDAAAAETLAVETLAADPEAALWRAVLDVRAGEPARALAAFRRGERLIEGYPERLQAILSGAFFEAAVARKDEGVAERELTRLSDLAPDWLHRDEVALMGARSDEAAGRSEAALAGYKALFDSAVAPVRAKAQLLGVKLALAENDGSIPPEEILARLETVAVTWRGDEVEMGAMGELGRIYASLGRWRDAFALARSAIATFPDHPVTRALQDETAQQFEGLFTSEQSDKLPRVEALALFYDFKEMLPVGRRGDEITRRLADRLVELDLLPQAAELLQHQIDNRITGAAKAIVATRLAMIRLMSGRPAEALQALGASRLPELPADVQRARMLLEVKALSDLSRTDLALEILETEQGPEVERLRADIYWTAKRWREAGETQERIAGEAWRGSEPLSEQQREDVMRAAIAYVMAEEALSLDRLRSKFAERMAETPDARLFAFVTGAALAGQGDMREIAGRISTGSTLDAFIASYRERYPDLSSAQRPQPAPAAEPPAPQAGQPGDPAGARQG